MTVRDLIRSLGTNCGKVRVWACPVYSQAMPAGSTSSEVKAVAVPKSPRGLTALGIFLCFGAAMACFAGTTLLWRGTVLDRAWKLNPTAYRQLAPLGVPAAILFFVLSAALLAAAIGWFRRRLWGWKLAVAIIAIQVVGDLRQPDPWRSRQRWSRRSDCRRAAVLPFASESQNGICKRREVWSCFDVIPRMTPVALQSAR